MYDNLDLYLPKEQSPNIDFLNAIPQHLTRWGTSGESEYGEYVTGYLDSLKVKITNRGVKIYDSSICKYYLGDNFKTLSKGDTKRAIEQVSDSLHLPFDKSKVMRIDVAKNMIMQHPESVYLPYLGEAQYYTRLPQNNGLYYNLTTGKRQMLFYGKEYEQKTKRQPIPELYKDRNVLRFEMRYKKQLPKQLRRSEITGALLYDEAFYYDLVARWRDEYLNIQKINTKLNSMRPTGSKKQLVEDLALFTILEVGQAEILNKVKEWQDRGEIGKKQAYDLRKAIKELSSASSIEQRNELIQELDKKVKEAARF